MWNSNRICSVLSVQKLESLGYCGVLIFDGVLCSFNTIRQCDEQTDVPSNRHRAIRIYRARYMSRAVTAG